MKKLIKISCLLFAVTLPLGECQKIAAKFCLDNIIIRFPPKAVIGGSFTKKDEFPHMVALGYGKNTSPKWLCGGTLISNQFVLTAAHCIEEALDPLKVVRINSITLENPIKGYSDFDVQRTYVHPRYNSSSHYNDIALVKLSGTVPTNIRPACLHTTTRISSKLLTATGWGRTDFAGPTSNDLLKVNLRTFTSNECNPFYKNAIRLKKGIDNKIQLCAGGPKKQIKDTCDGDSGGPLSYKSGNLHYVTGITSFGKACGLANVPAVYTRVSAYVPWIESIVFET